MQISSNPVLCALIASLFTWGITVLGAGTVFFFRNVNTTLMDGMLGFGAGVMIAASFFSLLMPAMEYAQAAGGNPWLIPSLGFLSGGALIIIGDKILARLDSMANDTLRRSVLLVSAVTLHNIPEGMVVGVAFAGAAMSAPASSLTAAVILAAGIGLQNFPEGAGISLPLRRDGYSLWKSFLIGQFSGLVEVPGALLGAVLALSLTGILPFFLALSAGAMISVVTAELIPSSVGSSKSVATIGVIAGFLVMMVLDVALG